ncbi:hypothetical protein AY600_17975 [Phormidium willei BDU 130791]|nr:hypothetical protein AY600_17975 [Phormidium willei BDU 130791]
MLRCFCEEKTVQGAAAETRVSVRSVRSLFERFREALLRAALEDRFAFGWAGYFLFENDEISARGAAILDAIASSDLMRWAIERHGVRVGLSKAKPDPRFSYLLFETAVRVFCALSMKKGNDTLYGPEIHEAYANLQLVALYIHMHKDGPEDPAFFDAVVTSFERIMRDFPRLLEQEEFSNLVAARRHHLYMNDVLYNDLRRYLLKNPL